MTRNHHFEALYETYFSKVYSYFSLCFNAQKAQDYTQQTFLNVWKALCRPGLFVENERAWIFRIAVNVKNDALRQKQRQVPTQELLESIPASGEQDALVESVEISQAFSGLSQEDRDILLMKNMGLTSVEIAKVLKLSASAVRSRLAAARRRFSQILREKGVECVG